MKTKLLRNLQFKRCLSDPCVFTKKLPDGESMYVIVYVDDCVVIGPTDHTHAFIQNIGRMIDIKILGKLKKYNGGHYDFDENGSTLTITQKDLIIKLSKDMKLIDTKIPGSPNGCCSRKWESLSRCSSNCSNRSSEGSLFEKASTTAQSNRCLGSQNARSGNLSFY